MSVLFKTHTCDLWLKSDRIATNTEVSTADYTRAHTAFKADLQPVSSQERAMSGLYLTGAMRKAFLPGTLPEPPHGCILVDTMRRQYWRRSEAEPEPWPNTRDGGHWEALFDRLSDVDVPDAVREAYA